LISKTKLSLSSITQSNQCPTLFLSNFVTTQNDKLLSAGEQNNFAESQTEIVDPLVVALFTPSIRSDFQFDPFVFGKTGELEASLKMSKSCFKSKLDLTACFLKLARKK
jgi:hypothetical protein